ncbi:hypothetical protein A1Q1_05545 [Trichosporon asahii var. asahii CBS 2479]|uniref:MHYT domain-containing protein n=1 Tax=Trichosporon asahii var. asahii (strain ATCC 90039 / CBS 2479 / JCM 2466 / KCTC 7840 / NBRC 103889/ NCYC 2677 / UAMH 7654) TaxID=1186058 RepID=J6ENQ5_TRIAS|nr:hypothetical protein A1Q1_05545 [Trichosporon asahii var. asahii CBS 2479]EJT45999.1 hypothetical protein A1Q1_05545 [Trichosporon asahii var. asahii CBS 2479]
MQPVASSSKMRLPRRPARIAASTATFVLALTAPYLAAARPLPDSSTATDPAATATLPTLLHPTPFASPSQHSPPSTLTESALLATLRGLQRLVQISDGFLQQSANPDWPDMDMSRMPEAQAVVNALPKNLNFPKGFVVLEQEMTPGFIVLSYFISLVGSLCTLELLIRRTSNRGLSNIAFLTAAGICFGAVSTFAMHFVGNQALALYHPLDPKRHALYLTYSAGYTVLSMVASCLAMIFAFFVMGTDVSLGSRPRIFRRRNSLELRRHETIERWKAQRPHLKATNVDTIFAQAGMSGGWSLSSQTPSTTRRTWYQKLLGRDAPPESRFGDFEDDDVLDESSLVKRDKDLDELNFRLGREAVRAELDRRQILGAAQLPATESPGTTPNTSLRGMPMHMTMGLGGTSAFPKSPLAPYYSAEDTALGTINSTRSRTPPSPMNELFATSYQFPPRSTPHPVDSQTHLIPKSDGSTSSLVSSVPTFPRPYAPILESTTPAQIYAPPQHIATGRRSSYPALAATPLPRAPPTTALARIQSLPENDADSNGGPYRDSSESSKDNQANGSGSDENTIDLHIDHLDHVLYDDEPFRLRKVGWREELRDKIQAGAPLTKRERALRFFGLDIVTLSDIVKVVLTGTFAGWGVAAMHYVGQISINDIPYIGYRVAYVVGSVVIASGAVCVALYIMFIMLRPKLKHSWVSKIVVGLILAGAVCGMHYTAMMGTIYGWEADKRPDKGAESSANKRAITGLVAALAFVACLGVATFILVNSIRDRKERARRRRIVVASVLLDEQGRMLVSAIDGLLPMCDIASLTPRDVKKKNQKNVHDQLDLTTANDAFVQSLKMSWSWRNPFWSAMNPFASVTDLLTGNSTDDMSTEMSGLGFSHPTLGRRPSTFTNAESVVSGHSQPTQRLSVARFLERFALAATQLSVRLTGQQNGIGRLGVLYDHILTTGWVNLSKNERVSKGQLIFLVRRISSVREKSDLLSRHFIFAPPSAVATALHKTLSTPYNNVMPLLEDMRGFVDTSMRMTLRPNTLYAGVVVVQATPFDGLRILLDKQNRSQLPMREVCTFSTLSGLPVNATRDEVLSGTLEEIGEAASWLEGMTLLSVISRNMNPEGTRVGGPRVGRLLSALERAIIPLMDDLLSQDDMAYILPRLQLHPLLVPLTPATPGVNGHPGWAAPHMLVFYANYDFAVRSFAEEWAPFSLFRAQNECVMASKINRLERAAEAAAALQRTTPRAPSPTLLPGTPLPPFSPLPAASPLPPGTPTDVAAKYNFGRRPSKVQFQEPDPRDAPSPVPTNSDTVSSRERPAPRRSSLARTAVMSSTAESPMIGVGVWDPNWLVHLLRTHLRAEPEMIGKETEQEPAMTMAISV